MVSATKVDDTGKKIVTVKIIGHKKILVSICPKAKDGAKLSPFIIFKGAKRGIKNCCIASSPNNWMNTELTHTWVISFRHRFIIWNLYEYHIEDTPKSSLQAKKIDVSTVSGGCTKYMQAPDVSLNKTFKALATRKYFQWLAEEVINQLASAGNLKPPPRCTIVNLILEAWEEITPETIKNSFKSCALNLATDGSENNLTHCFKEG